MIHRMDPPADPSTSRCRSELVPMLAPLRRRCPRDEAKLGLRGQVGRRAAIAYWTERARARSRAATCSDITPQLPGAARRSAARSARAGPILDGEIVAFDERGPAELRAPPDAHAPRLRGRGAAPRRATRPSIYVIFDLLYLDGHSTLRARPTSERRELLEALELEGPRLADARPTTAARAAALLDGHARARGSRGSSPSGSTARYEPGRRSSALAEGQERREPGAS